MAHLKSERKAVELLCCRHELASAAVQLPLLHHVHRLNCGNQLLRTPKRFEAHHWIRHSFDRPLVLLLNVVEVFRLAKFDVQPGVGIDAANGRSVGAAFVNGDFLGQTVQIDGAL